MSQPVAKASSLFKLEYPQSVAVFNTYDEAQHVVDYLADARFPVENLCIVGTELRSIERVLGRRSWGTVIGSGVQSGLSTGIMITLLMWLFLPAQNLMLIALYALLIGIAVGVAMAGLNYWMSQGKRDFTSVSQTVATKYEVLAEHKVVAQARDLLAKMPGVRAAQFNLPGPDNPYAHSGYPQPPAPVYGQPLGGQPYPQPGYPPQPYPQPGYPEQAFPQPGYPQQPYPQPGYPEQGYPQPGSPQQGYPEQAHAQQAYPQQAYAHPQHAQQTDQQHSYPQTENPPAYPAAGFDQPPQEFADQGTATPQHDAGAPAPQPAAEAPPEAAAPTGSTPDPVDLDKPARPND